MNESIEDLYELSPMQQGIFFHARTSAAPGDYAIQILYRLEGPLNARMLAEAWQRVVDRTPVLRTSFHWEVLAKPLQLVHARLRVALRRQDWSGLAPEEQQQRLAAFLDSDRVRPFEMQRPPLMRLSLIRLGRDQHHLVWTFHHVILEGWSAALVLEEVFAFYEAFTKGRDLDRPLRRPYRDYIVWMQERDPDRLAAYWRATLDGFREPTPIEIARSEEPGGAPTYARRRTALDEARSAGVQSFARRHQLTVNTLVQGAWALLLGRYTGCDDVVFGSVVSGRQVDLVGVDTMVGLFVNTLPARVTMPHGLPLVPWLRRLQESQAAMREFEYAPLSDVQALSGVRRGSRMFESLFAFENWAGDLSLQGRLSDLAVTDIRVSEGGTGYPLAATAAPGRQLSLSIVHDTRRFDGAGVARLLGHFEGLLAAMPQHADAPLGRLPMLDADEERRIVVEWNATARRRPDDRGVVAAFEAHARRAPEAPAVVEGTTTLTYGELDARSNQLARRLRALGVGVDDRVAIGLDRGSEAVTAALAVLKAGGAYVPLDPRTPRERAAFILADCHARLLITRRDGLDAAGVPVLALDKEVETLRNEAPEALDFTVDPENLAYVVYTSGSTGRPKGVEITHRGLRNLVSWHCDAYRVVADDRASQVAAPSFDAAVWEVWPYLTVGASVHVPDEATRSLPARLAAWLKQRGITLAFVPTAQVDALLAESWPPAVPLRVLLTGGEPLRRPRAGAWPFRIANHYGPAESAVVATAGEVVPDESADPPIGRPIDNTRLYVLDPHLRPAPVGVTGELFIAGDGLARGYAGDAARTAERFLPDPFAVEPGQRLYRTGDRVRRRADGAVEFVDRIDRQVKVRGWRVEPGEIEAVLRESESVRDVAVIARTEETGEKRLVAVVVPGSGACDDAELKTILRRRLPEAMVPGAIVRVESLPTSANGKIDRRALEALEVTAASPFTAPRNEAERAVAQAWQEVLHRDTVGVHDNFFDLGGHSLLLVQVHNRLRERYPDLAIVALFDHPTVDSLARHLGGEGRGAAEAPAAETRARSLSEGRGRLGQRLDIRARTTTRPADA